MFNRRHLRVKIMQVLYAYFQSGNTDFKKGEKELLVSIDKVYDLYLYYLSVIPEITRAAKKILDEARLKKLPTKEDLQPNEKLLNNKVIQIIENSPSLQSACKTSKINWNDQSDLTKKLYQTIKSSEEFEKYMMNSVNSFAEDKEFVMNIFKKIITDFEPLSFFFEEDSIYWADDFELADAMVQKTIKQITEKDESITLLPLFKDEEDDKQFAIELFKQTIFYENDFDPIIAEKTKNWEFDRIAMMDVLLMKMALAEVLSFPTIPVKVTLNEYIEISKSYSTPKSKQFINGILDKIIADYKKENKIKKTGRGLLE